MWKEKGLTSVRHLYINGRFASFDELRVKYNLPHSQYFRYLQIRDYVRSKITNFQTLPKKHAFFDVMNSPSDSKHLISTFVRLFDGCIEVCTDKIKKAWEEELGIGLSRAVWDKSLAMISSCSINSRHQLIQFKVVHRLHYSKLKLHKIYPLVSPMCDRCKVAEGTLSHAFWFCTQLTGFWDKLFDWFSRAYKTTLQPDAELALLGCSQSTANIPTAMRQSLMLGSIVAKRLILMDWKSTSPPSFQRWLTDMTSVIQMEKLRFTRANSLEKFSAIWDPFLNHLDMTRTR